MQQMYIQWQVYIHYEATVKPGSKTHPKLEKKESQMQVMMLYRHHYSQTKNQGSINRYATKVPDLDEENFKLVNFSQEKWSKISGDAE
ncbi:predicted protein [Sclerotinia sclerotiorum 1980 UF-70]|uniref:Uncharacterized protein n=1 Tax=Sclerotinia sclerotiorum (strain ATCC 18683 / 1980 / Ss-1) TaxID=665079 RepID=A7EBD6_SCLS1|nr:predicted protein [Sclerotinia sclerotiorum 1980 UF-70]EDN99764.1 predicted protein [Sclerotinia sclerotiorum 1980 UF-70]